MKRYFAMLLVLTILLSGCVSDSKKETEAASETTVSVAETDAPQVSESSEQAGYEEAVEDVEEPDLS